MTRLTRLAPVLLVSCAFARSAPPAPDKAPAKEPAKPAEPLPGLDELLGLPPAPARPDAGPGAGPGAEPPPQDAIRTELERKLTDKKIDDNFRQAVQLMSDVASRLARARDAGVDTQRTQEEIIRRLDALIEAAKEREQQKQKSSSQSQSQSQKDQQQNPTPQQQQRQQQQQQQQQAAAGDNQGEVTPPGLRTGALNKEALDAAVAAWGSLPERVRESLLQGMGDRFSNLYDALTQEYYRRLAEEKPRE